MWQRNHKELNQQRSRLADSASNEMDQELLQSGQRPAGSREMKTRVKSTNLNDSAWLGRVHVAWLIITMQWVWTLMFHDKNHQWFISTTLIISQGILKVHHTINHHLRYKIYHINIRIVFTKHYSLVLFIVGLIQIRYGDLYFLVYNKI